MDIEKTLSDATNNTVMRLQQFPMIYFLWFDVISLDMTETKNVSEEVVYQHVSSERPDSDNFQDVTSILDLFEMFVDTLYGSMEHNLHTSHIGLCQGR